MMDETSNDTSLNQSNTNSNDFMGHEDISMRTCDEIIEEPKVGMEFDSDDSAYKFYCSYAFRIGFSARKHLVKKNKTSGIVIRKTFCCSREGKRGLDKRRKSAFDICAITRIECMAQMSCALQKNGKFEVVSFSKEHNHDFVKSPTKHMLRSQRKITPAQKAQAKDAERSGLSNKQTVDLMSRQAGGREHLGFMGVDYRNYIYAKRRMDMIKGDAGAMLEYFQKMASKDPSFFYSIQLDEDDLITNIFWTDSRSMVDYGHFGDVVCFDTTYRTNEYGRPFAPIIGVNHHKQTVIFGAALFYDEKEVSFTWVFETFLEAMSGKFSKTILTDQSQAMANAIKKVFPETNHRLCVRHIYQNAAKHLNHVFHASKQFTKEFGDCVYDYEDEDEWKGAWNNMTEKYGLVNDDWIKDIYKVKEKWAMVYGRHMFTADMKSTQRSESMNNVLKKYLDSKYNLLRFFEHYDRLLADLRYEELIAEFKMAQTIPVLLVDVETLRHAVEVYTPAVFKMFQHEYMKVLDCTIHKISKSGTSSEYRVTLKKHEHKVIFDLETNAVQCSCMKFTFVGILCAHALKVLDKKNIKRLPSEYILTRWTKEAKNAVIKDYRGEDICEDPKESSGKRYTNLCHYFREVITIAAEDENMAAYAYKNLGKLLQDLQEMKKQCSFGDNQSIDDPSKILPEFVHSGITRAVRGIKTKPTVGRPPKSRFKDPLENTKKNKKHTSVLHVSSDPCCNSKKKKTQKSQSNSSIQIGNPIIKRHKTNQANAKQVMTELVNVEQNTHTNSVFVESSSICPEVHIDYMARSTNESVSEVATSTQWSQRQMTFTQLLHDSMTTAMLFPNEGGKSID